MTILKLKIVPRSLQSIAIITVTLLSILFVKMELRREGYNLLKLSRELRVLENKQRVLRIRLVSALRHERVRGLIEKSSQVREASGGHLIVLSGDRVALRQ